MTEFGSTQPTPASDASNPPDLPRPPGAIRRGLRAHPRWVDAALIGVYLLLTVSTGILGAFLPVTDNGPFVYHIPKYAHLPQLIFLLLSVSVAVITLLYRRRYPVWGLTATVIASSIAGPLGAPIAPMALVIAILLYSIPVYRSVKAGWVGYLIALIAELLSNPLGGVDFEITVGTDGSITNILVSAGLLMLYTAIPVILGINAGNRQRYLNALVEHAHQLARERDHLARLAVAEERTRIAREMHDIVAHSVSVMVTLSEGAANVMNESPEDATAAMQKSAETGRLALSELRSLIRILRDGDAGPAADIAPAPGIASLPNLVQGFRDAGLEVTLTLTGAPVEGADRREQGREVAIYRAVQEALTNTLRHAGPSAGVTVSVHQGPSMTTVVVEDDGGVPGHARPMSSVGAGAGLLGLAERLRLFQGELVAGPTPSGGWKVTVTMPTLSTEEDSDA